MEAIGCLGEIGPIDLSTLVLKPEKNVLDVKCTEIELFAGYAISLLGAYIHDRNFIVVKAVSEVLYTILQYKEPQQMASMYAVFQ